MSRPSKIWLITDTHFFDNKMVEICGRPANYDQLLLGNLRQLCVSQDVLIHLGDVTFDNTIIKGWLDLIQCKTKILLRGNHDKKTDNWYLNHGFHFVCDQLIIGHILLSHKPVRPPFPDGVLANVHGHLHNFPLSNDKECSSYYDNSLHRRLAVEYTDYKPVSLREFV